MFKLKFVIGQWEIPPRGKRRTVECPLQSPQPRGRGVSNRALRGFVINQHQQGSARILFTINHDQLTKMLQRKSIKRKFENLISGNLTTSLVSTGNACIENGYSFCFCFKLFFECSCKQVQYSIEYPFMLQSYALAL